MFCTRAPVSTRAAWLSLLAAAGLIAACNKSPTPTPGKTPAPAALPSAATATQKPSAAKPVDPKAAATKPAQGARAAAKAAGTAEGAAKPETAAKPGKPSKPPVVAKVGGYAPDFELPGVDGQTLRMSSYKGRVIVLEWFNPDCPFVKNAHTKGPLKDMARKWQAKGVFWIAINSGAKGKQGHGLERNKRAVEEYGLDHPVLLDELGVVGRSYGADHTPHLVVIDGLGKIQYLGALDNLPFGELTEPGAKPTHYVDDAIEAVLRGQAAPVAKTASWGCSVKYAK